MVAPNLLLSRRPNESAEETGVESGTIVQEFQKGYRWGHKLLRPARVQVAQ
jgi:molecular chaperone GrpE (heat shock protein)